MSRLTASLYSSYYRFFKIEEIEQSNRVRALYFYIIFANFVVFQEWLRLRILSKGAYNSWMEPLCWPYFLGCEKLLFLNTPPASYSHGIFYSLIFTLLLLSALNLIRKNAAVSHVILAFLVLVSGAIHFIVTPHASFNYFRVVLVLSFFAIFVPNRVFFLRHLVVLLYVIAGTLKIHEGWIQGTYFSTLELGLPLLPDAVIPYLTNYVILLELIGSWGLLAKNNLIRKLSIFQFFAFHLYSIILVDYFYSVLFLPILFLLFRDDEGLAWKPAFRGRVLALPAILVLLGTQYLHLFIKGDVKLTLEGNDWGVFMFDANHQCLSSIAVYDQGVLRESKIRHSTTAYYRCNPYNDWFKIRKYCDANATVAWTFDHSINGEPYYRIVETTNACALDYKLWRHNEWIRLPEEGAEIVALPRKNLYESRTFLNFSNRKKAESLFLGTREEFAGYMLHKSQLFFRKHYETIAKLLSALGFFSLVLLLLKMFSARYWTYLLAATAPLSTRIGRIFSRTLGLRMR